MLKAPSTSLIYLNFNASFTVQIMVPSEITLSTRDFLSNGQFFSAITGFFSVLLEFVVD